MSSGSLKLEASKSGTTPGVAAAVTALPTPIARPRTVTSLRNCTSLCDLR
jgi:hypothetical protein